MISNLLFTESRRRVLVLLLLHPEASYHVREIARLTHTSAGSLHRELSKLADEQVLIREVSGNQVYYKANQHFLIFDELVSILHKTSGLVDVLGTALAPLAGKIDKAFVFGSIPKGTANSLSDVDVLIIGELNFAEAVKALYAAQETLGREINPKIFKKQEWMDRINEEDSFVIDILKNPKYFIIGDDSDVK